MRQLIIWAPTSCDLIYVDVASVFQVWTEKLISDTKNGARVRLRFLSDWCLASASFEQLYLGASHSAFFR